MFDTNLFSQISLNRSTDLGDILSLLAAKFDRLHSVIINEFGPNGVYVMAAFSAFIILILLIYIKSVVDTFRIAENQTSEAGLFYTSANGTETGSEDYDYDEHEIDDARPRLTVNVNNDDFQTTYSDPNYSKERQAAIWERDRELSRDLVKSSAVTDDILQLKEKLKDQTRNSLDWSKNEERDTEKLDEQTSLSYQQPQENINELIGLIINMLSRDISSEKITQAVYFRNKGEHSQEDVLQTVNAVRDFISLCNNGKLDSLPQREELPANDEAVYFWANGDNSLCLKLLENLIKQQIDYAETKENTIQDLAYTQASSYACLFGTIALTENKTELAQNSFELALELAPHSINAWSRCADVYWQAGLYEKAVFSYQTVAENGDEALYASQIANAQHHLAEYYRNSGQSDTADKLENDSHKYYTESGIITSLSDKENETLNIIAAKQHENLQSSITKLLANRQKQYA